MTYIPLPVDDNGNVKVAIEAPDPVTIDGNLTNVGSVDLVDTLTSITNDVPIKAGDTPTIDAFARLRVSNPETVFDSQLQYDKQPLLWDEWGAGTSTHNPDESTVTMAVTSGQTIHRQTFNYHRYQPGKSQLIFATALCGACDQTRLVKRSNVTGSVVNTEVEQANWNENTQLDYDFSSTVILYLDLEWLGVGRVRMGIVRDGLPIVCHEFLHAGIEDTTYMTTANLPVKYEVISDGVTVKKRFGYFDDENGFYLEVEDSTTAIGSMKHICSSVISEGGQQEPLPFVFSQDTGNSAITVGATEIPLISIRPKATFNSITNRAQITPLAVHVGVTARNLIFRVYFNGTLTGPSWTSADSDSVMEYDTSSTAYTPGIKIDGDFVFGGSGANSGGSVGADLLSRFPLALDHDGLNPTQIVITAVRAGGTNAEAYASVQWKENR